MRNTNELNEDGFRVIAVAYKEMPDGARRSIRSPTRRDLMLLGYIAFLDPPKETRRAGDRARCNKHGVAVKVLTGDNDIVTPQDLPRGRASTSTHRARPEIEKHERRRIGAACVEQTTVFAKLSPAQKAAGHPRAARKGHVVGFLGDGINDAPALRAADVGISVDTAVDIAKESADIILLEKSLLVLEEGVIEGRKVFGNIIKYIKMGASSNFGNMFSVLGASAFLPFLPMLPIQVLTNNLLYDFSQTAIPTDNVDEEYLAGRANGTSAISSASCLHRADQLDFRLCDLFRDDLRLQLHGTIRRCSRPAGSSNPC